MLSNIEKTGYLVGFTVSLGVLLWGIFFLSEPPKFIVVLNSTLVFAWVSSWLLWRFLCYKTKIANLDNNKVFGVVILAVGSVILVTYQAINLSHYTFDGTGYKFFLTPLVLASIWIILLVWWLKKKSNHQ
ncbi:MAG: hypothetical protein ACK41E_03260 [Deinococcales bacterium]